MTEEKVVERKKFEPKFKVASRGFVAFPAYFIDELMLLGKYIPPSFWKFLLVVWRDVNHHQDNSCNKSMKQFHIRPSEASKWTAALMVSNLFLVTYGWKHKAKEKGVPTRLVYFDRDFVDWQIFIDALNQQVRSDKENHYDDCGGGFRAELLLHIIHLRKNKYAAGGVLPNEKEYLQKLDHAGFVKVESKGVDGEHTFSVKRLRTSRAGVLSAREQIEGAYPSKSEPDYDEDTGKQIRMYRQLERSVAKIIVRTRP